MLQKRVKCGMQKPTRHCKAIILQLKINLKKKVKVESVIQREKNKYHILTHIYGVQKNGTDEPIHGRGMERQL